MQIKMDYFTAKSDNQTWTIILFFSFDFVVVYRCLVMKKDKNDDDDDESSGRINQNNWSFFSTIVMFSLIVIIKIDRLLL